MASPGKRIIDAAALERLTGAVAEALSGHPDVVAAYLFGSAARGEPAADLDVALLVRGSGLTAAPLEALAARIQTDGAPHGPHVDLRLLVGTSPRFRANVLRDGRLLYEGDRAARLAFEARSHSEWLDYKPTWERMRRLMLERWANG